MMPSVDSRLSGASRFALIVTGLLAGSIVGCAGRGEKSSAAAPREGRHVTSTFSGAKVNAGTVTHNREGEKSILTLSDDFKVPETPAPHWQVVDSAGNTYLLQRLVIKGDKLNKMITVPSYVPDIAEVQIWCAWAESLLGEASFSSPVK